MAIAPLEQRGSPFPFLPPPSLSPPLPQERVFSRKVAHFFVESGYKSFVGSGYCVLEGWWEKAEAGACGVAGGLLLSFFVFLAEDIVVESVEEFSLFLVLDGLQCQGVDFSDGVVVMETEVI